MRGWLIALLTVLIASGCSTLSSDFDPPQVTLESFRGLPRNSEGMPRFELKLRVANPNVQALDIAGISYTVEILGAELLSGVGNDIPRIEGYASEVVALESSISLFQLLKLLASLGLEPHEQVDYKLSAKIDFNGLIPTQRVTEEGVFDLNTALGNAAQGLPSAAQ
jgi:LEA14-like dessication related protein